MATLVTMLRIEILDLGGIRKSALEKADDG